MHAKKVTRFIKLVPHIPVPTMSWGPQKGLAQGPACRQIHLRLGGQRWYYALFIRGLWYGLSYEGWGRSIQKSNRIRSRIRPTTQRKYNPLASKNIQLPYTKKHAALLTATSTKKGKGQMPKHAAGRNGHKGKTQKCSWPKPQEATYTHNKYSHPAI